MADHGNPLTKLLPNGFRRQWTSRFTKKVTDWIAGGIEIDGLQVVVDTIEPGDNPFIEELYIGFRVLQSRPSNHQTVWHRLNDQTVRAARDDSASAAEPRFYFTLTAEIPFQENITDFRSYVTSHLAQAALAPARP